ncbi:glycosyl transferase family protein [Aurantiacibacter gangjinensis]|uniref:Uncharacterized protein n=1 Tax=Aurantiacibacter gangjinensis TaxID=502682 RepID=A0A0G9MS01_9SPHN|nr:glycosyl transferase family protein [Aurantiacibacter gangjinensis]APE27111.1 Glycosyltransferase [Aurantiacibacter gangjinensis]KLE33526.1 hypothetical protein AAW01_06395 [Aurantiacibacter gangjinensis]
MLDSWTWLEWLALVEHELLLFAGVFFLLGALDEFAVDIAWFWLRLTGRAETPVLHTADLRHRRLGGRAAVFIPAWEESSVIADTLVHMLGAWPQADLRIYVGVYRNDAATLAAAATGAADDARVRIVIVDEDGPTTKADCLNTLYRALERDELRERFRAHMVLLHDAEDMVDPAALALLDRAVERSQFVQLPVLPMPQTGRRWLGSHYCEEFAEAHGKAMVVRGALARSIPAAGVGCAFDRDMLARLAKAAGRDVPFDEDSLTEDYELGLKIAELGGKTQFLRVRSDDGRLIATRSYFPGQLRRSVRQKARWMHGIALQGWDRMGWSGGWAERWMRLRDRRGPLAAIVLLTGYTLLFLSTVLAGLGLAGFDRPWEPSTFLLVLIAINLASFVWRAFMRFTFTRAEYGWRQGLLAMVRIPVTNVINIMAGMRALAAYGRTLRGAAPVWEKTSREGDPVRPLALEGGR